jgi:hypothetical protein
MALTREVGEESAWDIAAYEKRHKKLVERTLKFYSISAAGKAAAEKAQEPDRRPPTSWLVNQKPDSKYADVEGEAYDYPRSTSHGRLTEGKYTIASGDFVICFRGKKQMNPGIFGVARVGDIEEDASSFVAIYDWYEGVDPPLDPAGVAKLPSNFNLRNAIHEVDPSYAEAVLQAAGLDRPPPP